MDSGDVSRAVHRIAHEILEHRVPTSNLCLLGIPTRGVPLARRIAATIEAIGHDGDPIPVGTVHTGSHRDDIDRPRRTAVPATGVQCPLDARDVVLVDDVLFTGRTVRAALDALTDIGRARSVRLAVLVDRGHRELPIRADYVGKNLPTSLAERVVVRLDEVDGEDGVWLETPVVARSEPEGGANAG